MRGLDGKMSFCMRAYELGIIKNFPKLSEKAKIDRFDIAGMTNLVGKIVALESHIK